MIIVKLKGGMGNQMFQYALGRRLSIDLNTELKLNISGFENQPNVETKRHYDLYHFNIVENMATKEEIKKFEKFWPRFLDKILRRHHVGYEPEILNQKGDIYLDGFWHSEKYFENIREILQKEFTLKHPLSASAEAVKNEIQNSSIPAVSLHVRRGDYATDPATSKYHGLMTTEYYGGAIQLLKSTIGSDIKIFIFSDDIEWVKKHIPFGDAHFYVSNPAFVPYHQEVYLMSLCQHHIIANSSFSWWGAWLNQNPNKIVIAPEKWLASKGSDYYKEVPESWVKI